MSIWPTEECQDSDCSDYEAEGDILVTSPAIVSVIERLVNGPELEEFLTNQSPVLPSAAATNSVRLPSLASDIAIEADVGTPASNAAATPEGAPFSCEPFAEAVVSPKSSGGVVKLESGNADAEFVGTLREIAAARSSGLKRTSSCSDVPSEGEVLINRRQSWTDISRNLRNTNFGSEVKRSSSGSDMKRQGSYSEFGDGVQREKSSEDGMKREKSGLSDVSAEEMRHVSPPFSMKVKKTRFSPSVYERHPGDEESSQPEGESSQRTTTSQPESDNRPSPDECAPDASPSASSAEAPFDNSDSWDGQESQEGAAERSCDRDDAREGEPDEGQPDVDREGAAEDALRKEKDGSAGKEKDDLAEGVILSGTLWKKRSKLTKKSKVFRLLRRGALEVLSKGEDWLSAVGNLDSHKVADMLRVCRDAWSLFRGDEQAEKSDAVAANEMVGSWEERHVRLFKGGWLAWSKPPSEEHGFEDPSLIATTIGPLCGSSVEYLGLHHEREQGLCMHALRLFPIPQLRGRPLVFAAKSAEEARLWISSFRDACAFRSPTPAKQRPVRKYLEDFWNAEAPPPESEPPCAVLRLEVVSVSGLVSSSSKSVKDGREGSNPYVLGSLGGHQFRTITRYDSGEVAQFGQAFNIPIDLEEPDAPVDFQVFSEPEYDDQEPFLLGGITVPLFMFGRRADLNLVLPLTQTSEKRRGVVNASLRQLVLRGHLDQPTGHLFLPVEPPIIVDDASKSGENTGSNQNQSLNMGALEKQVARMAALIDIVVGWVTNIAFVLQWEKMRVSLFWFVFMQAWMLLFWDYSITVVALLLLRNCSNLKPTRTADNSEDAVHLEPLPSFVHQPLTERDRAPSMHMGPVEFSPPPVPKKREELREPPQGKEGGPVHVIWEHERRVFGVGFSHSCLVEGIDPPHWTERGWESRGPLQVIVENDVPYRYRWKVVVDENTDENGWQYAKISFGDAEWCRVFDSVQTWVRRRERHGFRVPGHGEKTPEATPDVGPMCADESMPSNPNSGPHQVEAMITENDLYRRYVGLYLSVTDVIDFWLMILEKHKNLITWKDETVTWIIVVLLVIILVLSFVVPYRFVFSGIVALSFYIGAIMGRRHRENRRCFLERLENWCKVCSRKEVHLSVRNPTSVIDECGITRLELRDWCNSNYRIQLDLRTVDKCMILRDLANLVIEASSSPDFVKVPRRYRSWHSDFYGNFMDHVPSDTTDNDVGSYTYKEYEASSLPVAV